MESTATRPQTKLLTTRQVADQLGLHTNTIYNMTCAGELHAVRFGRAVRYRAEDIERLIQERLV